MIVLCFSKDAPAKKMVSRIPTGNWSNRIERREGRDIGLWLILESWTRLNVAAEAARLLDAIVRQAEQISSESDNNDRKKDTQS